MADLKLLKKYWYVQQFEITISYLCNHHVDILYLDFFFLYIK